MIEQNVQINVWYYVHICSRYHSHFRGIRKHIFWWRSIDAGLNFRHGRGSATRSGWGWGRG